MLQFYIVKIDGFLESGLFRKALFGLDYILGRLAATIEIGTLF